MRVLLLLGLISHFSVYAFWSSEKIDNGNTQFLQLNANNKLVYSIGKSTKKTTNQAKLKPSIVSTKNKLITPYPYFNKNHQSAKNRPLSQLRKIQQLNARNRAMINRLLWANQTNNFANNFHSTQNTLMLLMLFNALKPKIVYVPVPVYIPIF